MKLMIYLLSERLNLTPEETRVLMELIKNEAAASLGIHPADLQITTEFKGRDINLLFSFDRQLIYRRQSK